MTLISLLARYCLKISAIVLLNMATETKVSRSIPTWRKVVAGVLFVIPWIVYLLYPTYNTAQPELGGVPFFYWYQTLWLFISAILFLIAVLLLYPGGGGE